MSDPEVRPLSTGDEVEVTFRATYHRPSNFIDPEIPQCHVVGSELGTPHADRWEIYLPPDATVRPTGRIWSLRDDDWGQL